MSQDDQMNPHPTKPKDNISARSIFGDGSALVIPKREKAKDAGTLLSQKMAIMSITPTFTKFAELPLELELLFWQVFIREEISQRFVPLLCDGRRPHIVPSKHLFSPTLAVCRTSRGEALRYFYTWKIPLYKHVETRSIVVPDGLMNGVYVSRQYAHWDEPSIATAFSNEVRVGTLYLCPERDLFVRGLPNSGFEGSLFDRNDTGLHTLADQVLELPHHSTLWLKRRKVPCLTVALGPNDLARVRRLAVAHYYFRDELAAQAWRYAGPYRIDDGVAANTAWWDEATFPRVREHFTIYTDALTQLTTAIYEHPGKVADDYDLRRWTPSATTWRGRARRRLVMGKDRSDGLPLDQTADEPEDFDTWCCRCLPWDKVPHPRYFV
ncbi:uncharacterized protein JN550_008109 [Neoarthrinium moseri]|uniref:uncharacterized protein n=1 Tax=Neoarthrinium moseri TaxID=1658444 RepID=UPI001FDD338F|nr:uncharacterized protein JN550_008109 [Neoarthrinium moseri]KAI1865851.1 hypothetical protein JN550_008109 [Neoarthrinium moseri]